jgi:hypothetical protein
MAYEDCCPFSLLPKDACEALLLQAWQQLDQRHRFGIIPRVCSSWFHLSLPTYTSLELALRDDGAIKQFAAWLRRHGSTLQHLNVKTRHATAELLGNSIVSNLLLKQKREKERYILLHDVLASLKSCESLTSLHLLCWEGPASVSEQLLSQFTSLSIRCSHMRQTDYCLFYRNERPRLRALDLHGCVWCLPPTKGEAEVHQLLSALPNLTSLDLTDTWISLESIASCPTLPPLQELKLSIPMRRNLGRRLAALSVLPCTSLDMHLSFEAELEEFRTWSVGQQGRSCLGRLTSMHWCIPVRGGFNYGSAHSLSGGALSCLVKAAGQLRHLALTGDTAGVKELALLSGLTQLTSLRFYYAGAADADIVTPLAALPNLQHLEVAHLSAAQKDAVTAACAAAGQLPCLTEVDFL